MADQGDFPREAFAHCKKGQQSNDAEYAGLGRWGGLNTGPKTLMFGGSFDPPHIGHMNLLRQAVAAVRPDEVLVVPSGTSPHKSASETAWPIRAAMCECFRPVFPGLVICDIEKNRSGKSYTYDTLAVLAQARPDKAFYLCIGGDMLKSFVTWYRWQDILQLATLVVSRRTTQPATSLHEAAQQLQMAGGRVILAEGAVVPAASSEIRALVAAGQDISRLVPPPVAEIVRKEKLYMV